MWRHVETRHLSCSSTPADYLNSQASGLKLQSTVITGNSAQHRMSGQLSSMSWRYSGHSGTGPCGCWYGLPLLCIMSSLSTMTCLITWMAWCELWPRRRHNARKTYCSPWSLHGRSCPNVIAKWLQRLVCFSFRHTFLILSGSCDGLGSGTREWILLLKKRLHILTNTRRPFWIMWRTNSALNIDVCRSLNLETYQTPISSPPQWVLDLVNLVLIHMICPAIIKNT